MNEITNDPIEGLISYTREIKPFHSKVIEVVTEYVHRETAHVTATESVQFDFIISVESASDLGAVGDERYDGLFGTGPYDTNGYLPVISINRGLENGPFNVDHPGYVIADKSVSLPGDVTATFRIGRVVVLTVGKINIQTGEVVAVLSELDRVIDDSQYIDVGQTNGIKNNPYTKLVLSGIYDTAATTLGANERFYATITPKPADIDSVIVGFGPNGTNHTVPVAYTDVPINSAPLPTIDSSAEPYENFALGQYVNSIVLSGDTTVAYPFGAKLFLIVDDIGTEYTTVYSYYDSNQDKTIIRILEELPDADYSTAKIAEKFLGYSEPGARKQKTTNSAEGLAQTTVSEKLVFSWNEDGQNQVIDGHQYKIRAIASDTITVSIEAASIINGGDTIRIQESVNTSNNGFYTVDTSTIVGAVAEIKTNETLTNTAGGGWIETT